MKKKVRLPFEEQPVMRMYHNMAFPTGIIQGNAKEDITPWLCGKCINCLLNRNRLRNQFGNLIQLIVPVQRQDPFRQLEYLFCRTHCVILYDALFTKVPNTD